MVTQVNNHFGRKFFNLIFIISLFLNYLTGSISYAVDLRHGVLLPSESQLQQAVRDASNRYDEPLSEPDVEVMVPVVPSLPIEPELSTLEKNVAKSLEAITLEEKINKQVVQAELEQFGYDMFSQKTTTFAPVESIPVPLDYIVGPGDTFILQIYGPADVEYRLVVNREGKLLVPEIGDIQVAGITFEDAKLVLKNKISKMRIGVKAVITLAELHTINVMMVGDVSQPGSYTISGMSSLLNTLITTGGIKRSGSLRNIQVKRNNKTIAIMDLYEILLEGSSKGNIFLRHNDVVFVPPIGDTVGVAGEVNRPAIYEIKQEKTVNQVLRLSGGLLPTGAADKTHIERITSEGFRTLKSIDLNTDGGKFGIKNGDLIRIFPVSDKMDNVVLLSGHVLMPGGFQWYEGIRVSNLISSTKLLRQSVDYQVALIQREVAQSNRITAVYFNLAEVLSNPGSKGDPLLLPRDQIIIFDTSSKRSGKLSNMLDKLKSQATVMDPPKIFAMKGFVKHAGDYPLQKRMRLLDAINVSGGLQAGTDMKYVLLVRHDERTRDIGFIQLNLNQAKQDKRGDHNPLIKPEDRIYIFNNEIDRSSLISADIKKLKSQTRYGELTPVVTIDGPVSHAGMYPLIPGMRVNDFLIAAGGLKEDAFGVSANLTRQELINGELTVNDHLFVKLTNDVTQQHNLNTILHPYDHLILRKKPEWANKSKIVKLTGEVKFPGQYKVGKRETLCALVQRAGGLTEDAYLFGSVFLRESIRKSEQQALDRLHDELDDILVNVHLSPGYDKDSKLPLNKGANDIHRVMKQLKRTKAYGRLVIDMESAVNRCDEENDVALEDGDHLFVPKYRDEITVVGEVYYPSSHQYKSDRASLDYINLSGGMRELAASEHTYIVQANGEVMTSRNSNSWGWLSTAKNVKVSPGSTIYVPLSVDRINDRESTQTWVDIFYKLVVSAASVDYVF